jgi:Ca2+-binding RTX toxin-like protein
MRQSLRNRLVAIAVAVTLGGAWTGIPRLASAGVVRVEGSAVIFKAGNNEVNTIVIDKRGAGFNPETGEFVQGFAVSDSTAQIFGGAGCRKFVGAVVCDITNPSFISLDLGDKNDTVSQREDGDPGDVVPMRVKGGAGNDTLTGGSLGDDLDGELGDDTITGGGGSDSISGGIGKDTINARDGANDTINCGLGRDVVTADASDTKKRCN